MHIGMLVYLADPVADAIERLSVCDIINQKNSLCSSEIRRRDSAEAFLAGRVPDLRGTAINHILAAW